MLFPVIIGVVEKYTFPGTVLNGTSSCNEVTCLKAWRPILAELRLKLFNTRQKKKNMSSTPALI